MRRRTTSRRPEVWATRMLDIAEKGGRVKRGTMENLLKAQDEGSTDIEYLGEKVQEKVEDLD